jgi:glycosyltransferase involved in cell wall biosynthesis
MRLLLIQNASHLPALGGANKSNRALIEHLAARGHACAVIAAASDEVLARLPGDTPVPSVVSFRLNGVDVDAVVDSARLRDPMARRIRSFAPDWVLVSSEDPAQTLLEAALEASPGRVIYLARTTLGLPCGPQAFLPSEKRTELLRRATAVLAVSHYVAGYLRRWAGIEPLLLPLHFYGADPGARGSLGGLEKGYVTLVNPCAVKGISIFLELARRLPAVQFAAVPTWGTTAEDREALTALPNVTLLPPSEKIDEVFAHTRILLVPSLWGEAFGTISVEAMLRGIPVLASDFGGLPEAKLGIPYLLPVRPIERYRERLDGRGIPVPEVPAQDAAPWEKALRELLEDRALYERLARQSRETARTHVAALDYGRTEAFLQGLPAPVAGALSAGLPAGLLADPTRCKPEPTSSSKLELLKRRLKQAAQAADA